jgi:hypothetical protein
MIVIVKKFQGAIYNEECLLTNYFINILSPLICNCLTTKIIVPDNSFLFNKMQSGVMNRVMNL